MMRPVVAGGLVAFYISRGLLRINIPQTTMLGDMFYGVATMVAIAILASAPALMAVLRVSPRELLTAE